MRQNLRSWFGLTVAALAAGWFILAQAASPGSAAQARLRTFFAFERDIWMETRGARLAMGSLKRHPNNPVIPLGEGDAHDSFRVSSASLLPEGERLRAWYGSLRQGAPWYEHYVAYAESEDGIHWRKPQLDLVQPGTNIVLEGAGSLVVIPEPGGGYRAAAQFWREDVREPGAGPGATFEIVTSPDGYRWDFQKQPATDIRHFEMYGFYRRDGRWWVLGQGVSPYFHLPDGRPHRRVMYGFYSEDGKSVELYPRPLFHYPIEPYFPDAALQNHVGAAVWDRDRILIGLAGQLWPSGFSVTVHATIGLIYSYDGLEWFEPFPRTPLLMPDLSQASADGIPAGAWDEGMLFQVQRPVNRGDLTYFYYTGGDSGNTWNTREALGLATLRRDGLAFFTSEERVGELLTVPIRKLAGENTLYINAKGPLTVQLLDRYLRPTGAPRRWSGDDTGVAILDLEELEGDFRLSLELEEGAQLYTFSLGPAELPDPGAWE